MGFSIEQAHQCVKEWGMDFDLDIEVEVLQPHDDPRERGQIVPVRLCRHGYHMTVGLCEDSFGSSLTDEARKSL